MNSNYKTLDELRDDYRKIHFSNLPLEERQKLESAIDIQIRKQMEEEKQIYLGRTEEERAYNCKKDIGRAIAFDKIHKANNPPNTGCFVATACYGDSDAPEVQILRHWRDSVLTERVLGRIFIKLYYIIGPLLSNWMKKHPQLLVHVRYSLDKFIQWL